MYQLKLRLVFPNDYNCVQEIMDEVKGASNRPRDTRHYQARERNDGYKEDQQSPREEKFSRGECGASRVNDRRCDSAQPRCDGFGKPPEREYMQGPQKEGRQDMRLKRGSPPPRFSRGRKERGDGYNQ